jgi:predicted nucleic acid-binding Zn ribbon protein
MPAPRFAFYPPLGAGKRSAKQRVLAEWRGADLSAAEKARANSSRRANELLPRVLKDMRMDNRRIDAEIVKVWRHAIDPNLAAHAQPTGYHKGTLFVTVDSSPWLDEIVRWHRKDILKLMQHSFGREFIKKISFRTG